MSYSDPEKQKQYQRERVARRRDEWLQANGPCAWCGSWSDLEVDHRDRTTKVSHNVWSWSPERREAELAKCQVLCHPCHAKKTADERGRMQHGTDAMYGRGKCRCDPCRAARQVARARRDARAKVG